MDLYELVIYFSVLSSCINSLRQQGTSFSNPLYKLRITFFVWIHSPEVTINTPGLQIWLLTSHRQLLGLSFAIFKFLIVSPSISHFHFYGFSKGEPIRGLRIKNFKNGFHAGF